MNINGSTLMAYNIEIIWYLQIIDVRVHIIIIKTLNKWNYKFIISDIMIIYN